MRQRPRPGNDFGGPLSDDHLQVAAVENIQPSEALNEAGRVQSVDVDRSRAKNQKSKPISTHSGRSETGRCAWKCVELLAVSEASNEWRGSFGQFPEKRRETRGFGTVLGVSAASNLHL